MTLTLWLFACLLFVVVVLYAGTREINRGIILSDREERDWTR
jgi:hypothetical protein